MSDNTNGRTTGRTADHTPCVAAREDGDPGAILVSASTQRLVAQQIDTRPVGMRPVRGLAAPIELHEVVVGTESSAAAPLTRKQRWAPLVGREDSLQVLGRAIETVQKGAMRVIGLRGDAGVGKSRLIADWTGGLSSQGVDVCVTQARGYASTRAYSAIADLIANMVGLPRTGATEAKNMAIQALVAKWPAEGADHLAAVSDLLGLAAPNEAWLALIPAQRRRRIGEALLWLVRRRLQPGPFVLVVEDFFLADRESQRLLEALISRLQGLPVLICSAIGRISNTNGDRRHGSPSTWWTPCGTARCPPSPVPCWAMILPCMGSPANWFVAPTAIRSSWNSWSSR